MKAGWVGQMAGVGWGAPTEFKYLSKIIPANEVPEWKPERINVFGQDDLYVEMTFLRSLKVHGFDLSIKQAGIDFANSAYHLYVANRTGRKNLRKGITPPNSGHPNYNENADAIDYQIEADFSGLFAPGTPNLVIELGNKFGHLMNYGDDVYGGQFVGAMYAEAFFESDPVAIVEAGLKAIPAESQYAEAIRDVINWYKENPGDWEATWKQINQKYHEDPDYRRFMTPGVGEQFNIDAKINGAYIVMGLLYGKKDPDKTIIISMRCGQNSDCNPSNAAGILFTSIGFDKLPGKFVSNLAQKTKFSFTDYTFPTLIDVCEKLARRAIERAGGKIETVSPGGDVFVIPVIEPILGDLEQSWNPAPLSKNTFTKDELTQIEEHWIYNFSLLFLVLLVIALFKENRNLKEIAVLIPWAIVFISFESLKIILPSWVLDEVNVLVEFQSLATVLAIILLIGLRVSSFRWYISTSIALVILAIVGYTGAVGAYEGRYVAGTESTLNFYALQALVYFLAFVLTILLCRKNYNRLRFNLFALLSLLIIHIFGTYIITLVIAAYEAEESIAGNIQWILIGAVVLTVVHYLVTLPYLILTYRSPEYDLRFRNWIE